MSDILIAGATGFVGRHLVSYLAAHSENRLWAVSRHGGEVCGVRVAAVDLSHRAAVDEWRGGMPTFSAIVDLAASVPATAADDVPEIVAANVGATANLLRLACDHHAYVVYASSAFIYASDSLAAVTEDATPQPSTNYHLSKYVGEQLCELAERRGVPSTRLRMAATYGPGQRSNTVLRRFVEAAKRSDDLVVFGTGDRTQDFVHVSDVVRAVVLALRLRVRGTFHVASGRSVRMEDLAGLVRANVRGCRSVIRLSGTDDPLGGERWEFSTERARRQLGFVAAMPLAEGIRAFAEAG